MALNLDAGGLAMSATAGFCGAEIRGDCRVTAFADKNPTIQVRSRVQSLYGEAIRTQADAVRIACGAQGMSLIIEDEGALPFTIAARIETAIKRADPAITGSWLPTAKHREQGAADRPRRTRLYLPGNTPKFFINAGLYGSDAVILDLEDSVAPQEKDAARILVRNALRCIDFKGAERMVRVNSGDEVAKDVEAVVGHGVEAIILPKAESARQVHELDQLAGERVWIIPLIETAKGITQSAEIASASPRVVALSVGLEDYLADIGAKGSDGGEESAYALAQIVTAARAAGVPPLGPMFAGFDDKAGLDQQVHRLTGLGFEGFSCIHPMQVPLVHQAMMPTDDEVESAKQLLTIYRQALKDGKGAVAVAGKMVDAPVAARAERTLRRAGSVI